MENKKILISVFERAWGTVYELFSKEGKFTVAIEIIPAGKMIKKHYHNRSKEIEVVLDGTPLVNNQQSSPGNVFVWNLKEIHEYNNIDGETEAIILTISMPDFDINDEIFI